VRNRLGLDDATAERLFKRAEELVVASPLDYELRNVQSAILLRRSLARRSASLEMWGPRRGARAAAVLRWCVFVFSATCCSFRCIVCASPAAQGPVS